MTIEERIAGFAELPHTISNWQTEYKNELFTNVANTNPWFTPAKIEQALNGVLHLLNSEKLEAWLDKYNLPNDEKRVGIIMAGNIPLVGFHDLLCVMLAGYKAIIKLSSQDNVLLPAVIELLVKINPEFGKQVLIVDKLAGVDAVIATGSDNSARYFKKYFKDIPHIIRKNRTSAAVINGDESAKELQLLGEDIFSFFGLGCRNVAKIYVPVNYDMKVLLDALEGNHEVINHPKYFNNYEYNKAIYLVNRTPHLDTGYALFTQSKDLVSPLSVIFYEEYEDEQHLNGLLESCSDKIQCIVSNKELKVGTVAIGQSQFPNIDDYADNIDTMAFLCNNN